MTGRHQSPKPKLQAGVACAAHFYNMQFYSGLHVANIILYNSVLCCKQYFSLSSVILYAFSAICVHSKFGHHPRHLGYTCAKFYFFCDPHCWANPWRKIRYSITQSITHSITQLIWCPGNQSFCFKIK